MVGRFDFISHDGVQFSVNLTKISQRGATVGENRPCNRAADNRLCGVIDILALLRGPYAKFGSVDVCLDIIMEFAG